MMSREQRLITKDHTQVHGRILTVTLQASLSLKASQHTHGMPSFITVLGWTFLSLPYFLCHFNILQYTLFNYWCVQHQDSTTRDIHTF